MEGLELIKNLDELNKYKNLSEIKKRNIFLFFECEDCHKIIKLSVRSLLKKESLKCNPCSGKIKKAAFPEEYKQLIRQKQRESCKNKSLEEKELAERRRKEAIIQKYGSWKEYNRQRSIARKNNIIKKYGSLKTYEAKRKRTIRETVLAKCKTDEERKRKRWELELDDKHRNSKIKEGIIRHCDCCGREYTTYKKDLGICRSCILLAMRTEKGGGDINVYWKRANARFKKTCLEKYGVENPTQTKEVQQKAIETSLKKYGTRRPQQNEKIKIKIQEAVQETYLNAQKYIVENTLEEIIKDNFSTFDEKKISSLIKQFKKRRGNKDYLNVYIYDNNYFDSSWELYYYLYLKHNNISFIFRPKPILYNFKDRLIYYYPDFLIGNQYIEIKGDHLFNNHFAKEATRRKYEFMKEIGVKILLKKDLQEIFDLIDNLHGKDYVKQFRLVKKENILTYIEKEELLNAKD